MQTSKEYTPEEKRRRKIALACVGAFLILFALLCWFAGRPMLDFVAEPQKFREWVGQYGLLGKLAFVGMVALQVVVAVIPGEPLEIAAGYAFGIFEGTLLCLIGITLGSALVFLFVRKWGIKAVELFFPREKIQSLAFLQNSKRLNLIVFILFYRPHAHEAVHLAGYHHDSPHPLCHHLHHRRRCSGAAELPIRHPGFCRHHRHQPPRHPGLSHHHQARE